MSRFKPGSGTVIPERKPMPRPAPQDAKAETKQPLIAPLETTPVQKVALSLTLLFIFLRFSFLHEFVTAKIGFDTHLLLVVGIFAIFAVLIAGNLGSVVSHRIFLLWSAFALWMCLATVTSVWKGASFGVAFPYLRTTLVLVAMIPAVTFTSKNLSRLLTVIGMSAVVPILLGLLSNDYRSGRLELNGAGASIENSNDFAALLILVLPALAYWTLRRNTNFVLKAVGLALIGMALFLLLGTGSRGALIALIGMALYMVKMGSTKIRFAILVGIPVLMLAVVPFLPPEASQRLASLFNSKDQTEESLASKEQRQALLIASLRITAEHPLLGIGPANFDIYEAREANDLGERGMWHQTHNSYTQVSSECGIPALCFYLCAMAFSFAIFSRGRKSPDADVRAMSQVFSVMLVSFAICMFFLSQAYGFGFPVLGGIAIALDRLMARQSAAAAPD